MISLLDSLKYVCVYLNPSHCSERVPSIISRQNYAGRALDRSGHLFDRFFLRAAPIKIERFVEKQFKTALIYEDLGPGNLGCTIFNSSGTVEAILVTRFLEEQNPIAARRRVRSTAAHEARHGLLHGTALHGNQVARSYKRC